MKLIIEPATPDSTSGIVRLMHDFAAYEKLSAYCTITVEKLHDVMFGKNAFVNGVVANDGTQMIGYALFYKSFSSFRGQRGYFLEDLYVDSRYRGQGIGFKMLKAVVHAVSEERGERLDFLVLSWNEKAIRFYESLGADRSEAEIHFKFTDASFDKLASR